jgi:hypothetical protein
MFEIKSCNSTSKNINTLAKQDRESCGKRLIEKDNQQVDEISAVHFLCN